MYTQFFNLSCDRADDVHHGRLPVHVRCLLDKFAKKTRYSLPIRLFSLYNKFNIQEPALLYCFRNTKLSESKERRQKMVDYSQFEASTKSGIHADVNRIRQKDEIIRAVVKKRKNSALTCVCFACMAGISLLKSWIPALIFVLFALFFLWRAVGKFSDEYLREMYEEGLLVPGMIVKTEPLTIMAIANMVAQEGAPAINGCYCLEVKALDGARKELFEKIPCSCFFCYEGGDYHSSFQPHPLYWGTADQQAIAEALRQVEEDNRENAKDEWEVLKEIAQKFPDLGNGNMILLDENYVPFGKKNYMDSNYQPLERG